MTLLKRILCDMAGNRVLTGILAAITVVVSASLLVCQYIYAVVDEYNQLYADQAGNSIMITSSYKEPRLFASKLNAILAWEHVTGWNRFLSCSALPVDFQNAPYETDGVFSSAEDMGEIRLIGNACTWMNDLFRTGDMVLVSGKFPTEQNRGLLISEELAEENGIGLGDSLSLRSNVTAETEAFTVTGIYSAVNTPKEEAEEGYLYASGSYVFCDLDSYARIDELNDILLYAYIFVDEYKYVETVCGEIMAFDSALYPVDCFASDLETDSAFPAATILRKLFAGILGITGLLYLVILYLVIQLWLRKQYEKIGIYIVLGKRKTEIFMEIFWALEMILIPVILLTGAVFFCWASSNGVQLLDGITRLTQTEFGRSFQKEEAARLALGFRQFACMSGLILAVATLPVVLSLRRVLNINYRKLLEENNKM